jgi:outer membrane protein insertion porin family
VVRVALVLALLAGVAAADDTPAVPTLPRRIVGFKVKGHSKVTETTLERLSHVSLGDEITDDDIKDIQAALVSSELFKTVDVVLEAVAGGVVVVATVDDKQSWIAAPTVYVLPGNLAFGAGYAENDLLGEDKKLLLYGQIGDVNTFMFGTYLDPQFRGSKFSLRFDLYLQHRVVDEYENLDARSFTIARESTQNYLDGGALVGYTPVYWFTGDVRLRGAYVYFRDSHDPATGLALARPEADGRDISAIVRGTIDARHHQFGVSKGPFAQVAVEAGVPLLSSFEYLQVTSRASYALTLFGSHELELRTEGGFGLHLPFDQELTAGGASDQRGYAFQQFRGDLRATARLEYSVPILRYSVLAFRALAFWDSTYTAFHFHDGPDRDYLPSQVDQHWSRNGVGGGIRLYVSSIVLPLLGFDVGYGLESHTPQFYFEVGLTDF